MDDTTNEKNAKLGQKGIWRSRDPHLEFCDPLISWSDWS